MNVYDFDETIYAGDSTKDFILFLLRRQPSLMRYLPAHTRAFLDYSRGKISKTDFKSSFYEMFQGVVDMDCAVEEFWDQAEDRIYPFYLDQQRADDLIISASPEFLLEPIAKRLGIEHLLASRICRYSGSSHGKNCHGSEKVQRFLDAGYDPDAVESFYSDSCTDFPLAELAEAAFIVQDGQVGPWERPQKRGYSAFLQLFNERSFLVEFLANLLSLLLFAGMSAGLLFFVGFGPALALSALLAPALSQIILLLSKDLPRWERRLARGLWMRAAVSSSLSLVLQGPGRRSRPLAYFVGLAAGVAMILCWVRSSYRRRGFSEISLAEAAIQPDDLPKFESLP